MRYFAQKPYNLLMLLILINPLVFNILKSQAFWLIYLYFTEAFKLVSYLLHFSLKICSTVYAIYSCFYIGEIDVSLMSILESLISHQL